MNDGIGKKVFNRIAKAYPDYLTLFSNDTSPLSSRRISFQSDLSPISPMQKKA